MLDKSKQIPAQVGKLGYEQVRLIEQHHSVQRMQCMQCMEAELCANPSHKQQRDGEACSGRSRNPGLHGAIGRARDPARVSQTGALLPATRPPAPHFSTHAADLGCNDRVTSAASTVGISKNPSSKTPGKEPEAGVGRTKPAFRSRSTGIVGIVSAHPTSPLCVGGVGSAAARGLHGEDRDDDGFLARGCACRDVGGRVVLAPLVPPYSPRDDWSAHVHRDKPLIRGQRACSSSRADFRDLSLN